MPAFPHYSRNINCYECVFIIDNFSGMCTILVYLFLIRLLTISRSIGELRRVLLSWVKKQEGLKRGFGWSNFTTLNDFVHLNPFWTRLVVWTVFSTRRVSNIVFEMQVYNTLRAGCKAINVMCTQRSVFVVAVNVLLCYSPVFVFRFTQPSLRGKD